MKSSAFKQGALTGLCGPYGVANAFSLLYPGQLSAQAASALAHRLASALPCDFRTIMREGTDRHQMELMLAAAAAWTRERGWRSWSFRAMHPNPGQTAQSFWSGLAARLSRGSAAIIGFGDHDRPHTRYEPHWTCVERIGERTVHLLDSDEYEQVRRSATGIRPEPGWEIEDCFVLTRREASVSRQGNLFENYISDGSWAGSAARNESRLARLRSRRP
jgi:hypothetical protein